MFKLPNHKTNLPVADKHKHTLGWFTYTQDLFTQLVKIPLDLVCCVLYLGVQNIMAMSTVFSYDLEIYEMSIKRDETETMYTNSFYTDTCTTVVTNFVGMSNS